MRTYFIIIGLVSLSLLAGCKEKSTTEDADVLVRVKAQALTRSEVEAMIPRGISSADSLLLAESFVKKWVKDALIYEVASRNLGEGKAEVDKLVENYRHSLLRYRYQEQLVKEKLSVDIRESDKLSYFEENQDKFVLDKALIKGLFLKIPIDAPGLSEVKGWYKLNSEAALEKIEKYSVQNATIYDYFYDKWVSFDEVMDNIPLHVAVPNDFLKANKTVEVADSSYCYLLNIKEYLPVGSVEPYEYADPQIMEMLINQRRVEFLRNFEEELYNDAVKGGDVKFTVEP
ncbi:MAG: peptidyl-prolyl cis-trans isomerase [Tannerellaceae bacterium]